MESEMLKHFDFSNPDQNFNIEDVIKACHLNPQRKKFGTLLPTYFHRKSPLSEDYTSPSQLMAPMKNWLSFKKFNQTKISPFDVRSLKPEVNQNSWLAQQGATDEMVWPVYI